MATLADIIFRALIKSGWVTKGSALTWLELDGNFEAIIDSINTITASGTGNIAPYNPVTVYSDTPTTYVSYSGNVYQYINAVPSAGVTPGSDPATWELVSIGAFTHQQNTDTGIGLGTAQYVPLADIYSIVKEQTIPITVAAFLALSASDTLKVNRLYYFFTEGLYLVRSNSLRAWEQAGFVVLSQADIATYPQYDFAGAYAVNDPATWDNLVYRNLTGVNGGASPDTDPFNWVLVPAFTAPYYIGKQLACRVDVAAAGVTTYEFTDEFGNVFGYTGRGYIGKGGSKYGNIEAGESTIAAHNYRGRLFNNHLVNSAMTIYHELATTGKVNQNSLRVASLQIGDGTDGIDIQGEVSNCIFDNVNIRLLQGLVTGAKLQNVKISMAGQTVEVENDVNILAGYLNLQGGNIERQVSINVAPKTIDVTALLPLDLYGIYVIAAGTADTLTGFTNYPPQPIKIIPMGGNVTIETKTIGGGIVLNQFLYTGANFVLNPNDNDYMIIKAEQIVGVWIWRVIEVSIAI